MAQPSKPSVKYPPCTQQVYAPTVRNVPHLPASAAGPAPVLLETAASNARSIDAALHPAAVANVNQLWPSAYGGPIRLRVGFFNGDYDTRAEVKRLIDSTWKVSQDLIEFEWDLENTLDRSSGIVALKTRADIRLQFMIEPDKNNPSYSNVGVENLSVPDDHTMQYGWDVFGDPTMPIHEFGHVLGLLHEQQSPFNGHLVYDEDQFVRYLMESQDWDEETARQNTKLLTRTDHVGTVYDKDSIMHYQLPVEVIEGFMINGKEHTRQNDPKVAAELNTPTGQYPPERVTVPSALDIQSIRKFVPKASSSQLTLGDHKAEGVKALVSPSFSKTAYAFSSSGLARVEGTNATAIPSQGDWTKSVSAAVLVSDKEALVAGKHLWRVNIQSGASSVESNGDFTGTVALLHGDDAGSVYAVGRSISRIGGGAINSDQDWSTSKAAASVNGAAYIVNNNKLWRVALDDSKNSGELNSEPWVAGIKALASFKPGGLIAITDSEVFLVNTVTGRNYLIRREDTALWSRTTAACTTSAGVIAANGQFAQFTVPQAYTKISAANLNLV